MPVLGAALKTHGNETTEITRNSQNPMNERPVQCRAPSIQDAKRKELAQIMVALR